MAIAGSSNNSIAAKLIPPSLFAPDFFQSMTYRSVNKRDQAHLILKVILPTVTVHIQRQEKSA
jgi:hypothetical protein